MTVLQPLVVSVQVKHRGDAGPDPEDSERDTGHDHRMAMSALDFEGQTKHFPLLLVSFCLFCGAVTFTGAEIFIKKLALAGVAQWIELGPMNQRVTSSVPGGDPGLGFRPNQVAGGGRAGVNHTLMFHSLPLFLLPFPSLYK